MEEEVFSLSEVLNAVSRTIQRSLAGPYWICAEIAEISYRGHCYLTLAETDASGRIIAKCRATIWKNVFDTLSIKFFQQTGLQLASGMRVQVLASPSFHSEFGFSLNIVGIEPRYTLGEIALRRQETINRLAQEGIIENNKRLRLSLVPQKIAVISSVSAAGYQDFVNQLTNNPLGYKFYTALYPALMQGEKSPQSVIEALLQIKEDAANFDVVVIIRGGGSEMDLKAFDDYAVAREVALFPLPVLAGIGHTKDTSVVDIVAHLELKTPTAVADFLIHTVDAAWKNVEDCSQRLFAYAADTLSNEKQRLTQVTEFLSAKAKSATDIEKQKIDSNALRLQISAKRMADDVIRDLSSKQYNISRAVKFTISQKLSEFDLLEQKIKSISPEEAFKRGYSLTLKDGKPISISTLKNGDRIETVCSGGRITSIVDEIYH
ncbi:MAG: exodeoxyribonuclease VII large subunit [Bacteroidales bacterium]|jgi:exodeoxyribonuclease VII large subunit|nr:exodeoxyribonuclease VII large subunit [Bacteroidales bacterium]